MRCRIYLYYASISTCIFFISTFSLSFTLYDLTSLITNVKVTVNDIKSAIGCANHIPFNPNILGSIKSIDFIKLNSKDVVRHPLVQAIIEAYEKEGY